MGVGSKTPTGTRQHRCCCAKPPSPPQQPVREGERGSSRQGRREEAGQDLLRPLQAAHGAQFSDGGGEWLLLQMNFRIWVIFHN